MVEISVTEKPLFLTEKPLYAGQTPNKKFYWRTVAPTTFFNFYEHMHPGGGILHGVYIEGANWQMELNDRDSGIGHFSLPLRGWIQNGLMDALQGTMTR